VVLGDLKDLGVKLALDDFGTGYSSLSYLKRFPIDIVKVDQTFVADLGQDSASHLIVNAVVQLAHGLGMTVVAEGVETEAQRKVLAELGCDVVPGFLYAPALAPVAFERWLIEHCAEQARAMLGRLDVKPVDAAVVKRSA
jgi:EAL domain-containing protein (putative c-di-GMP-specific phosphodiesterase class I)